MNVWGGRRLLMGLGERVSVYMSHESADADGSTITAVVHELKDETMPTGVVHAWVGQIVTFFATAPPAAPWAP